MLRSIPCSLQRNACLCAIASTTTTAISAVEIFYTELYFFALLLCVMYIFLFKLFVQKGLGICPTALNTAKSSNALEEQ